MQKINLPALLFWFLLTIGFANPNQGLAQANSQRLKEVQAALPVVDKLLKDYAEKNHLPGLVYGIVLDGKLIHTAQMGFANLEKKTPVSALSDFHIASMTKSFTALAILKLRDAGKLKLDDPVYQYIPEMKEQQYLTTSATPVTIRHLLTHGAGFPEDNPWGDRQLAVSDADMLKMIKKGISFSTAPGAGYEYSNMGFAMLGYIIKKVSGQTYQKYITDQILLPLGMTHTYWDYEEVPANNLVQGYRWLGNQWVKQPMLKSGAYGAMGGLITTLEDFGKYVVLHLSATPPSSAPETGPVKRSSLLEMQRPWNVSGLNPDYKYPGGRACATVTAYGYGLRWLQDCDNRTMVGHSGGLPGFGSDWKILPDYGLGIITFSNHTYAPASLLNMQVLDTLISLAKLQPQPRPVSAILNQRKNELIKILPQWNQAQASGIFAENFFLDYFPDQLREEATALFKKAGKIIRIQEMVATNNLRGSFVMEGEKADIEIFFTLTPENPPLIQQYRIREKLKK